MNEKQNTGKIITFYSYKGGTGRTMILANIAWILASNGKRVLIIDWDLEAPGLHRYFYPFLIDKELKSTKGLIDFFIDFTVEAVTPVDNEDVNEDWYNPLVNKILKYSVSLNWDFQIDGKIDFIPAGEQGKTYSAKVNSFDWNNFYERLYGGDFLETVKDYIRKRYDYILIDSRTGVSDTSGICTIQMPDTVDICLTLNRQNIYGASAIAESIRTIEKQG